MAILECRNLVKQYRRPPKTAVRGVSLEVHAGEIVGLLGPNGAGKTTTFRMTCGMIAPTSGTIHLNGQDVTDWPMYKRARHGLGYLPQDHSVFGKLTAEENLICILQYQKLTRKELRYRVDELLHEFQIERCRKQLAYSMSGGEKRRLEIARCMATNPQLILLDEPFAGVDPTTINDIQDVVFGLKRYGIGVLLTDHRERETLAITDRNYVIIQGEVIVSGDAETVLANERAVREYFGRVDAGSILRERSSFESRDLDEIPFGRPAEAPSDVGDAVGDEGHASGGARSSAA